MTIEHVVVDGVRLRYQDVGPTGHDPDPAGEVLLLIPGHTARIEGYRSIVEPLSARRRVLVVEPPGTGGSEKPVLEYTVGLYADFLLGALDRLGVGGPVVPVGGSLGGNLVLRLGHRCPDRFARLVAWAPGSAWPARPLVARLLRHFGRPMFWPVVWGQSRFWYSRDWPGRDAALRDTFAYYREVMSPGFVAMYFGLAADQVGATLFGIAPELRHPTLLLWGDRDHGGGMGDGVARLARTIPDVELVTFPGARHSLEAEVPEQLAAAITEWLDRSHPRPDLPPPDPDPDPDPEL